MLEQHLQKTPAVLRFADKNCTHMWDIPVVTPTPKLCHEIAKPGHGLPHCPHLSIAHCQPGLVISGGKE